MGYGKQGVVEGLEGEESVYTQISVQIIISDGTQANSLYGTTISGNFMFIS